MRRTDLAKTAYTLVPMLALTIIIAVGVNKSPPVDLEYDWE